jgi:hypothetical protein
MHISLLFTDITSQNLNLLKQSKLHKEVENHYDTKTLNHKDDHLLNRKWVTLLIPPRNQTQNLKIQGREIIKVNVTTACLTLI